MPETLSDHLTDIERLRAFVATRDEGAFAAIVADHGPFVLSVCRRMLNRQEDAEDAAQAVFLILAAKAQTLLSSGRLEGFLHHVAQQVCLNMRKSGQRRAYREREAAMQTEQQNNIDPLELAELRSILDQAIDSLPADYRLPVVLHHLRGHTKAETARMLKEKEGTVAARLDRARRMLRERLIALGVSVPAAFSAALVPGLELPPPTLPAEFVSSTARVACGVQGAHARPEAVKAAEAILSQARSATRVKWLAALGACAAIVAGGALLFITAPTQLPAQRLAAPGASTALADTAIDEARAKLVPAIVKVRYLETTKDGDALVDEVEITQVLKNETRHAFGSRSQIARRADQPAAGSREATLYLVPSSQKEGRWVPLDAPAQPAAAPTAAADVEKAEPLTENERRIVELPFIDGATMGKDQVYVHDYSAFDHAIFDMGGVRVAIEGFSFSGMQDYSKSAPGMARPKRGPEIRYGARSALNFNGGMAGTSTKYDAATHAPIVITYWKKAGDEAQQFDCAGAAFSVSAKGVSAGGAHAAMGDGIRRVIFLNHDGSFRNYWSEKP